jgi:hypothetical protein
VKLNPRIWVPIAQLLTVVNVGAVYFAAQAAEPGHATLHAALAVLCTLGVDWLRTRARAADSLSDGRMTELDSGSGEMDQVRHELAEVQERLDFAERMLSQRREEDRLPRNG